MPEIEFAPWETPFQNGNLVVIEVRYLDGAFNYADLEAKFSASASTLPENEGLLLRVFHREKCAIYTLFFSRPGAFRVLDEHGLLQLWQATSEQGGRPAHSTFRVRHHAWSEESPVSFFFYAQDGWSYVIATGDTCVEVLSPAAPDIRFEKTVAAE
jgi:hypothetical protein